MVTPPAVIAATPVGATTIIRLGERRFNSRKNVVFPVPALPVKKILVPVYSRKLKASSNWGFVSISTQHHMKTKLQQKVENGKRSNKFDIQNIFLRSSFLTDSGTKDPSRNPR